MSHARRRLQQQCRFADPGLAAQEHDRARHDATAKDAVEFVKTTGKTWRLRKVNIGQQLG